MQLFFQGHPLCNLTVHAVHSCEVTWLILDEIFTKNICYDKFDIRLFMFHLALLHKGGNIHYKQKYSNNILLHVSCFRSLL